MNKNSIHGNQEPAQTMPFRFKGTEISTFNNPNSFTNFMGLPNHNIPFDFPRQTSESGQSTRNQNININITINNLNNISTNPGTGGLFSGLFGVKSTSPNKSSINHDQMVKMQNHFTGICNQDKHQKVMGFKNEVLILCNDYCFSEHQQQIKPAFIINENFENSQRNKVTDDVVNFLNSNTEHLKKKESLMDEFIVCCPKCRCYMFEKGKDPSGECCQSDENKNESHSKSNIYFFNKNWSN